MTAFAIYEEKGARHLPLDDRVAALTFVKDGFHWRAFWFSGAWLAVKGHWRALALWVVALVLIGGLLLLMGFGVEAYVWLWLALSLLTGLEAGSLEHGRLEREGARALGFVSGGSRADCELRALARLGATIERERQEVQSADV